MERLSCQAATQTCDPGSFYYATLTCFNPYSKRPSRSFPYSNSMRGAFSFCVWLRPMLSMPKPSMTFLIKKLEESGYLRRQGEKGDLRRYRLTISPAGIKARDKGAEAVNRIFGACLNSLSAADQATLNRIVDQLQPRTSKTKQGIRRFLSGRQNYREFRWFIDVKWGPL